MPSTLSLLTADVNAFRAKAPAPGAVIGRWDPLRPLLDVAFDMEDGADSGRETDYYYARVRQHDGERAWSSPVWVKKF